MRTKLIVPALFLTLILVGCSKDNTQNTEQSSKETTTALETTEAIETTEAVTTSEETEASSEASTEKKKPVTTMEIPDSILQALWKDMVILIDGTEYKLPMTYKDFKATGWDCKLEEYDPDDLTFKPMTKTMASIKAYSSKYGEDYNSQVLYVQLANGTDSDLNANDCMVSTIDVNCLYGYNVRDTYAEFALACGIKLGSTYDEMVAAYGEPDSTDESETQTIYSYGTVTGDGTVQKMLITLVPDLGIVGVRLIAL